jgi:hypothetical protein
VKQITSTQFEVIGVKELFDAIGFGLGDAKPEIVPILDAGGIRGVKVAATLILADLFAARPTIALEKGRGLRLELPLDLILSGVEILIPPFLKLTEIRGRFAEDSFGVGASLAPSLPTAQRLLKYKAFFRVPLKGKKVLRADGDLILASFLPLGHQEAVLDMDLHRFTTRSDFRLLSALEITGDLLIQLKNSEAKENFRISINGDVRVFGSRMAGCHFLIDPEQFEGNAMVSLLFTSGRMEFHGTWNNWRDTSGKVRVTFGFEALGVHVELVGVTVEATLHPSASLGIVVLGQDIRLVEVDLNGITIEKILERLLSDQLFPTGVKLFKKEGGGGAVVTPSGGMASKLPDGRILYLDQTANDGIQLFQVKQLIGGGSEIRYTAPKTNEIVTVRESSTGEKSVSAAQLFGKKESVEAHKIELPEPLKELIRRP